MVWLLIFKKNANLNLIYRWLHRSKNTKQLINEEPLFSSANAVVCCIKQIKQTQFSLQPVTDTIVQNPTVDSSKQTKRSRIPVQNDKCYGTRED